MRTMTRTRRNAAWTFPALLSLLAALFAFAALVLGPGERDARAAGPTAEEVGAKVQAFYDSTKTFRAKFKQKYTIKVQGVKKVSTGKVTFEKPGKMSWVVRRPERQPRRVRRHHHQGLRKGERADVRDERGKGRSTRPRSPS